MSNGVVIYEGPSQYDDQPIVVIVTGIKKPSSNPKTGDMLQAWILLQDVHPMEGLKTGLDQSICGDCMHRRKPDGTRSCYVNMNGPGSVWRTYKADKYARMSPKDAALLIAGLPEFRRKMRYGAYGDPGMVPIEVWEEVSPHLISSTGYTHQWRFISPEYSKFCMASADNLVDQTDATALGYRTFRCITPGGELLEDEIVCPASEEAGKLTQCASCNLCKGSYDDRSNSIPNVVITIHGRGAKHFIDSGNPRRRLNANKME